MEPEIARRCPACGASVRGGALFCPQCGGALKTASTSAGAAAAETSNPVRRKTDAGQSQAGAAAPATPAEALVPGAAPTGESAPADSRPRASIIPADVADKDEVGRSKRHRLAASARETVEEKLGPRVEKLRHASNVMLEEAAYDPSLRFVLVVLALVLLSLLILLLNYLLG